MKNDVSPLTFNPNNIFPNNWSSKLVASSTASECKNKLGWPLANIRNWYIYIRSLVSETFIPCVWCVLSRRTPIFYEDRCMPGLYKTPPCLRRQPLVSCQMIWSSKRWNSYRLKFAKAWSINIFFVIMSRFVRPQSIHLDCSRRSSLSERGIILNT